MEFEQIANPVVELLKKKNHDYGDSYFKIRNEYGAISFLVRLEDKFNRLKQLNKVESQVKEESIEDTIKDIVGYCILELKYRKENEIGKE